MGGMLDFSTPAHGWDVVFTALLTGGSVVLAYFLGRASERARDRWQRFDLWAARVSEVSQQLFDAAAARRLPTQDEAINYYRLWRDGPSALDAKDRQLWFWAVNILEDSSAEVRHLGSVHVSGEPGSITQEALGRLWMAAQQTPQPARIRLIGYRESRKQRKALRAEIAVARKIAREPGASPARRRPTEAT